MDTSINPLVVNQFKRIIQNQRDEIVALKEKCGNYVQEIEQLTKVQVHAPPLTSSPPQVAAETVEEEEDDYDDKITQILKRLEHDQTGEGTDGAAGSAGEASIK